MRIKKTLIILLLVIASCLGLLAFSVKDVPLEEKVQDKIEGAIVLYINSHYAYVNGDIVELDNTSMDVTPVSINGRTLVPIRFITEGFGAKVDYNQLTKAAVIDIYEKEIIIQIDSSHMFVDGDMIELDVPATTINSRMFIPLRALTDVIGKKLFYSDDLIVISDVDKIFDIEKDKSEIKYLSSLVNILPSVNTDEKLKELLKVQDNVSYKEYTQISTLTNQVVDTGDIVQLNNEYIYKLIQNEVLIIKTNIPNNMELMAKVVLKQDEMTPVSIYIKENKLAVVGKGVSNTKVYVYDVTNKKSPKLSRIMEIDGTYVDSKMIDGVLYFVSNKDKYVYESAGALIYKDTLQSELPVNVLNENISYFPDTNTSNFMLIGTVDIEKQDAMKLKTYIGAGDIVYMTDNSIYVLLTKYVNKSNYTLVYKFELSNGNVNYISRCEVKGKLITRTSMDEYDGRLRIATTTSLNSTAIKSNVYIFGQKMTLLSSLQGIAPEEQIYSTRFINNRLYMITYKTTDPLFVIDLSNKKNPIITGILAMPGFSDYLYSYDDTHIIGFGKDTATLKDNLYKGFKIGLFDVADVSNPKQLHAEYIGDNGTDSEIMYDYDSLLFSKKDNILALPVTVIEKGKIVFQGAYVYKLNLKDGFVLQQKISHFTDEDYVMMDAVGYDQNKEIKRIVLQGGNVFTLSNYMIKSNSLKNAELIGTLNLK